MAQVYILPFQGVVILLNANVGFSVVMCVIYRHQALLRPASRLKMSDVLFHSENIDLQPNADCADATAYSELLRSFPISTTVHSSSH